MKFVRVAFILAVLVCMFALTVSAAETDDGEMNETKAPAKVAPKVASLLKTVPWHHSQVMKNATAIARMQKFTINRQAKIDLGECTRKCNAVSLRELSACKQFMGSQRQIVRRDGDKSKVVSLSSCRRDVTEQGLACKKQCQTSFHY